MAVGSVPERDGASIQAAVTRIRARAAEAVRFHPREALALAVLGALVVTGATLGYIRARPSASLAPAVPAAGDAGVRGSPTGARIYVHVVGMVVRPGVYALGEGARVIDAVRAAGGFRRGADGIAVNLARPVADGEQVMVPRRGAQTPGGSTAAGGATSPDGKININAAGVAEFDSLPGIGEVLAERIVAYRDQHGPFRSIKDLMKVSGIGPKKFEALEELITV